MLGVLEIESDGVKLGVLLTLIDGVGVGVGQAP
jgi:hypothetical protein